MRQVKVKLIDSYLNWEGNQPFYIQKKVSSMYPGFTNLTGEELSNRLIEQFERFDTPIFLNETVEDIQKRVTSSLSLLLIVHQSKAVIIAMGGGAFKYALLISRELKTLITFTTMYQTSSNMKDSRWPSLVVGTLLWTELLYRQDCSNYNRSPTGQLPCLGT